jgi:hypothetical protein
LSAFAKPGERLLICLRSDSANEHVSPVHNGDE